jgi:outer membrane protein OmpA-like peptidoglycan-associated protein
MTRLVQCLLLLLAIFRLDSQEAAAQGIRADTLVVHFDFDRSTIRPHDSATLANLSARTPDSILLLGYTDTIGSSPYNQKLSTRRALAAKAALRLQIPIRLDPRGESNPLPGDDSLSRRALLIVYYHVNPAPVVHADTPTRAKLPGEPDTVISLNHINFIANKAELTDAAREALPSEVTNLRYFSNRWLEIDGFCNQPGPPLAKTDPLFILSVDRAKFIYHYLITQGFDAGHLSYKGLGNASPVNAHPTTKGEMDQNMRVEIKVFSDPPPLQPNMPQ